MFEQRFDAMNLVGLVIEDAPDARIHDGFQAMVARACGNVDVRAVDRDSVLGGLGDGVDFSMNGAETI